MKILKISFKKEGKYYQIKIFLLKWFNNVIILMKCKFNKSL